MSRPITVVLADDHALVRETLVSWLRSTGGIAVVGTVGSADEAIVEVMRLRPDVLIMDIDMPGLLCFDAARTIRARSERTRIIMLSAFVQDRYIEQALAVEASAYITKGEPPEVVANAVRLVASGATYFSPEVEARIVVESGGVRLAEPAPTRGSTVSSRELEVLQYIAQGLSKREIAELMHLSVKTVDNHSMSLMNKLDIHDRVELARYAIREGLARP